MKVRVFLTLLVVLALTATVALAGGYHTVEAVGDNTSIQGSGCPEARDGDEDGQFITIESGQVVITNYNRFGGVRVGDEVWLTLLKGCKAGNKVVYDLADQQKK